MKECYSGIDPFLDDITSFGTKIGMIYEWAVGDKEAYIKYKFEKYVVSEGKLNQILNDVVQQYMEGISGNINEMHTKIMVSMEPIRKQFDIPKTTIETLAGIGIGTTTSAGTGAAIGSIIPGFRTIVEFVVSVIIGLIIENRLDAIFREEMKPQIEKTLDEVKKQVKEGFRVNMSREEKAFMENLFISMEQRVNNFCDTQNQLIMIDYYHNLINNLNNPMGAIKRVSTQGNI